MQQSFKLALLASCQELQFSEVIDMQMCVYSRQRRISALGQ